MQVNTVARFIRPLSTLAQRTRGGSEPPCKYVSLSQNPGGYPASANSILPEQSCRIPDDIRDRLRQEFLSISVVPTEREFESFLAQSQQIVKAVLPSALHA